MLKYIYGLQDPITELIRYIGATNNPKRRYGEHVYSDFKLDRDYWIYELKLRDLKPNLIVLTSSPSENWETEEENWILYARQQNWPLVNISSGKGNRGTFHTEETRKLMSIASRCRPPMSDSRKEHLSRINTGKTLSKETKTKIGLSSRDRIHSEESKSKISIANKLAWAKRRI